MPHLGLRLVKPESNVFVQCIAGNQPFDARIRVEAHQGFEIKVEVTTAEEEDAAQVCDVRPFRETASRGGRGPSGGTRQSFQKVLTIKMSMAMRQ